MMRARGFACVWAVCMACADAPTAPPGPYVPGQSYFGRGGYIEYVAGNTPLIYTAAHGGDLVPEEIPDRTSGRCGALVLTITDANTVDLARRMQQAHFARFGTYPHLILNHLHRRKLDANRPLADAACGDAEAAIAWTGWHEWIGVARAAVLQATGKGWYMDVHGHAHAKQRLELGYHVTSDDLRLSDEALDAQESYESASSISTVSRFSPVSFSSLLRGPSALGTLYAARAFPAVPSSSDPAPQFEDAYFSGGHNTARHSCGAEASGLGGVTDGPICGVQLEINYSGVRDEPINRTRFAEATAVVMEEYLRTHFGILLSP
jgi:hypothetical protein